MNCYYSKYKFCSLEVASLKEKRTAAERPTLELSTQASATPVRHTTPQSSSVATATRKSRIPRRVPPVHQTISQVSLPSAATEKATSYCRQVVRFDLWC